MRAIPLSRSIIVFWEDLVFVEAALLAEDATKDLAAVITPVLDEFPATLQRNLDTRRAVIQANARAYVADVGIDSSIRGLFSSVLALVGQNRKRPEFTTLFSSHIGDVVRHALKRQVEVAVEMVGKLELKIFPDDLRVEQTKSLDTQIKRGKSVLDDLRKAELGRVEGRLDVRTWKQEANAARLTVYGQLLALAAKSGQKKAWADGFFPRAGAATGVAEEESSEDVSEVDEPLGGPSPGDVRPA